MVENKYLVTHMVKMIMRTVSKNPRTTRRDLMNDLQRAGTKVTKATISNTLHQEGLKSCSARRVPLLKPVCPGPSEVCLRANEKTPQFTSKDLMKGKKITADHKAEH